MAGRKIRGLSVEDVAIWKKYASGISREKPIPSLKATHDSNKSRKTKTKKTMPAIQPFQVGEKVIRATRAEPDFTKAPAATSPNMDRKNFQRLINGQMEIDATLDLHGLTADQAKIRLVSFIKHSHRSGARCILVITGKGKHIRDDEFGRPKSGVLRQNLPDWLRGPDLSSKILQVSQAQPKHGGAGAFYVYLRRQR